MDFIKQAFQMFFDPGAGDRFCYTSENIDEVEKELNDRFEELLKEEREEKQFRHIHIYIPKKFHRAETLEMRKFLQTNAEEAIIL